MGSVTLDEILLAEVDADPSLSGLDAPLGSYAFLNSALGGSWQKTGAALTDWMKISNETLLRFNRIAPYYKLINSGSSYQMLTTDPATIIFSGLAAGFAFRTPDSTSLPINTQITLINSGTNAIAVSYAGGTAWFTLAANSIATLTLLSNSYDGVWIGTQIYNTKDNILHYSITSSTTFAVTASTYTLVTGMTLTPVAGTYLCLFDGQCTQSTSARQIYWSLFKGGSQLTLTERSRWSNRTTDQLPMFTMVPELQFDGTQAVDIRLRNATNGTINITHRSLLLIRLGP